MLFATQDQSGLRAPNFVTATGAQPLLATFTHELRRINSRPVRGATKARDWNSPLVAHSIVDSHAAFRVRNILHWSTNMHYASVVVAHESLVLPTPARQIRWQRVVPEIYRRLDEIICKHAAADDSRVVMIELNSRDRDAWSNSVEYFRGRQSIRTRIEMT